MNLQLSDMLTSDDFKSDIPKGVTFPPSNNLLLVSFVETNSVCVYEMDWSRKKITILQNKL